MPTIRVDDEVMDWLRQQAQPFSDTPNSVLRRIAGLDKGEAEVNGTHEARTKGRRTRTNSGRRLNIEWHVGAKHALYHEAGTFYERLTRFPGALFDHNGYVEFKTEKAYLNTPGLRHGIRLNVPNGISSLRGYVKMRS